MIALTIKEQIRQAVVAALATVTILNGYQVNLAVQSLQSGEGNDPAGSTAALQFQAIVSLGKETKAPARSQRHDYWLLPVMVELTLLSDPADAQPPDFFSNLVEGDCLKALYADRQFGGLAIDTWIDDKTPMEGQGKIQGLLLPFLVHYRTLESNPYSL